MQERKLKIERIPRLAETGLRSNEIGQILRIPPRTVRYHLSSFSGATRLRVKATLQDAESIEMLSKCGTSVEEICRLLELNGRTTLNVLRSKGLPVY